MAVVWAKIEKELNYRSVDLFQKQRWGLCTEGNNVPFSELLCHVAFPDSTTPTDSRDDEVAAVFGMPKGSFIRNLYYS